MTSCLQWQYHLQDIDWQALSHLYHIAPLGDKPADKLEMVFSNSRYVCFVFKGAELIGAGRVLADGYDCAYICDVAIHPDYHGQGLGKAIMQYLINQSSEHKKILLYAVPGKEIFYQKLGFKMMNTAMAIFENEPAMIASGVIR
ncbi:GNAT family N-acetyltransferase [Motilimonas pumila]|uniref:GNAT family N-acetyltransferase n=1 Tax=Motilimonas pumila TaxID=2303987 RepID=A0A418YF15_9GAMM|nr:GNAT family N-acetyltransferase [Motilimonas pumila]RJG47742.1 GNAT family N-acetyltransferase [Motilimonas pumila]